MGLAGKECSVEDAATGDADSPLTVERDSVASERATMPFKESHSEALKHQSVPCAYTPKKFMVWAIDVPEKILPGKYFWIRYQNQHHWLMNVKHNLVNMINNHKPYAPGGKSI